MRVEPEPLSAYHRLGGALVVQEIIDRFYLQVQSDPELRRYLVDADRDRLKHHLGALLIRELGGPDTYSGPALAQAQQHLRVTARHARRFAHHLTRVMANLGVDKEIIAIVAQALVALQAQLVRRPPANGPPRPRSPR